MNYKKLLTMLTANWPAKMISIALALILFVFYRMNNLSTHSFSVQLKEPETSLVLVKIEPKNVKVNIRGEDYIINSIIDSDIEPYIDLSELSLPGKYNVPVKIKKKGSALDIEPLEITVYPLEVTVDLEQGNE